MARYMWATPLACSASMATPGNSPLCLVVAWCGIPARAVELEPAYVRTVFDQTNGLPTDEANAVLQTRDGYLWVGSYGGLLRFDGSEFHNFSTEGAIATPSIRCLFEDSAGRL